jgi:hypothetical protein
MSGPAGAAFIAAALTEMQEAPVDVANFFRAEPGTFGVFNEFGVPQANYSALLCFRRMIECPKRVAVEPEYAGKLWALAGVNEKRDRASVLLSRIDGSESAVELRWPALPWNRTANIQVLTISSAGSVSSSAVLAAGAKSWKTALSGPGVVFVTLTPRPENP